MSALKEGQVILPNVRCGYIKVWTPEAIKGMAESKPRYGLLAYLPKGDEKTKARLDREIKRLADTHFKGQRPKARDLFITDGDGEDGDDFSAGHWLISANRAESQGRPQVVNRNPSQHILPEDGLIVSGYRYNVMIGVYVPKNWSKICASLEVLQFVAKDDPFGAAPVDAEDVMPSLEDEDDFEA